MRPLNKAHTASCKGQYSPISETGKKERAINRIDLVHGQPIVFGANKEKAVVWDGGRAVIVDLDSVSPSQIIVHNAHAEDASQAFALSRLSHPEGPWPTPPARPARWGRTPAGGAGGVAAKSGRWRIVV